MSDRLVPTCIAGVREAAGTCRTRLVDAHGLWHDGSPVFPGMAETLERARQAGVTIVVLTKSAQRLDAAAKRLSDAGSSPSSSDAAIGCARMAMVEPSLGNMVPRGFRARDGMCYHRAEDAEIAKKMTGLASESIALVRSAKFERRARISGILPTRLSAIVTDNARHSTAVGLAQSSIRATEAKAA